MPLRLRAVLVGLAVLLGLAALSWVQFAHAQTAPVATKITSNDGAKVVAVTSTALGNALLVQPASSAPITFPTSTLPVSVSGTVIVSGTMYATTTPAYSVSTTVLVPSGGVSPYFMTPWFTMTGYQSCTLHTVMLDFTGVIIPTYGDPNSGTSDGQMIDNLGHLWVGNTAAFHGGGNAEYVGAVGTYDFAFVAPSGGCGALIYTDDTGSITFSLIRSAGPSPILWQPVLAGTSTNLQAVTTTGLTVLVAPTTTGASVIVSSAPTTTGANVQATVTSAPTTTGASVIVSSSPTTTGAAIIVSSAPTTTGAAIINTAQTSTNQQTVIGSVSVSPSGGVVFTTNPLYTLTGYSFPNPNLNGGLDPAVPGVAPLYIDWMGSLQTRGPVLTDEGSFRDDFAGTSTTSTMSGMMAVASTSTLDQIVGVGTHFKVEANYQKYFKLTSDPDYAWTQISSVTDDTHMTLVEDYQGSSSTSPTSSMLANWVPLTVSTGTSVSVSGSYLSITAGQQSGSAQYLYRAADYLPEAIVYLGTTLPVRNSTQSTALGFVDFDSITSTVPYQQCRAIFDGVDATKVKLRSGGGDIDGANSEEKLITLPNGSDTTMPHNYKIELTRSKCALVVDQQDMGANRIHLPGSYQDLVAEVAQVNTGYTATTSTLVTDGAALWNDNFVQIENAFDSNPILIGGVVQPNTTSTVATGSRAELQFDSSKNLRVNATTLTGQDPMLTGKQTPLTGDSWGNLYVQINSLSAAGRRQDIAFFGGFPVLTGWGPSGAGVPRFTISNDSKVGLSNINGANLLLGQTYMASSLPVVLAVNQPSINVSSTAATSTNTIGQLGPSTNVIGQLATSTGLATIGQLATSTNIQSNQIYGADPTTQSTRRPATVDLQGDMFAFVNGLSAAGRRHDIAFFGGFPVLFGWGPSGSGVPRVTISNDSKVGISNVNGANLLLGPAKAAASLPVVLAADQPAPTAEPWRTLAATWSGAACMGVVTSTSCLTATATTSTPYVTDLYFSATGAETIYLYATTGTGTWGNIPATNTTMLWRADCNPQCGPVVGLTSPIPVAASSSFYCVPSSISVSSTCSLAVRGL